MKNNGTKQDSNKLLYEVCNTSLNIYCPRCLENDGLSVALNGNNQCPQCRAYYYIDDNSNLNVCTCEWCDDVATRELQGDDESWFVCAKHYKE